MEKTIEIPEGYEARIDGNKVILEPKESEDERIRKMLIERVRTAEELTEELREWIISYLEKQKDEAQRQFNLGVQAGREEVLYEMEKEQKPAEWSEEDEIEMGFIIEHLNECKKSDTKGLSVHYDRLINWLKSLRPQPHWKPSKEQMDALISKLPIINGTGDIVDSILESLYSDLKKLM